MTDRRVDGPVEPAEGTAAEKAFENEGGPSRAGSPIVLIARASEPVMDRIDRSAGRIKARLAARRGR